MVFPDRVIFAEGVVPDRFDCISYACLSGQPTVTLEWWDTHAMRDTRYIPPAGICVGIHSTAAHVQSLCKLQSIQPVHFNKILLSIYK